MSSRDELYALRNDLKALKEDINRIERRINALIAHEERQPQQRQEVPQDLPRALTGIINRLEKDRGYASIDLIIAQAVRAGFDKSEVERELDRMLR